MRDRIDYYLGSARILVESEACDKVHLVKSDRQERRLVRKLTRKGLSPMGALAAIHGYMDHNGEAWYLHPFVKDVIFDNGLRLELDKEAQ